MKKAIEIHPIQTITNRSFRPTLQPLTPEWGVRCISWKSSVSVVIELLSHNLEWETVATLVPHILSEIDIWYTIYQIDRPKSFDFQCVAAAQKGWWRDSYVAFWYGHHDEFLEVFLEVLWLSANFWIKVITVHNLNTVLAHGMRPLSILVLGAVLAISHVASILFCLKKWNCIN